MGCQNHNLGSSYPLNYNKKQARPTDWTRPLENPFISVLRITMNLMPGGIVWQVAPE